MQLCLQIAGPNGGALSVHENGDSPAKFLRHAADSGNNLLYPLMGRVTHVEPEDIRSFVHQLPKYFRFLTGGAEGANDFGFAHRPDVYLRDKATTSRISRERALVVWNAPSKFLETLPGLARRRCLASAKSPSFNYRSL